MNPLMRTPLRGAFAENPMSSYPISARRTGPQGRTRAPRPLPDDVVYKIATRTDSPSHGYQVVHGNTSLAEMRDGGNGQSQNHFMLGSATSVRFRAWHPPATIAFCDKKTT